MGKDIPNLKNFFLYLFGIGTAALVLIMFFSRQPQSTADTPESSPSAQSTGKYSSAPKNSLKAKAKYQAILSTEAGEISVDLFAEETPVAVNNFVFLSREGFYDGTVFHRVIKDFMIQGGDPNGDGSGGPGYTFADESIKGDYKRGIVAMANRGPDSNGSQFFIMHKDKPDLSKLYVIFGQVTSGMETVDKIATAETIESGAEKSTPLKPVKITKVTIKES